jgi:GT2 family glycosyltransferase
MVAPSRRWTGRDAPPGTARVPRADAMAEQWPPVSVIVVNLDGRAHLETCLGSLAEADYPAGGLEVIVFDNGSTDGSREMVQRLHPRVRLITHPTNLGFAQPNNLAARAAGGEYLALLNNDVRVPSGWLKRMVAPLRDPGHRAAGVACTAGRILNWDGDRHDFDGAGLSFCGHGISVHLGWPLAAARPIPHPAPTLFACGASMVIRRDVFLDVGGFDEEYFAYYEDVDLGWRLWSAGHQVLLVPEAVTFHRHHGTAAAVLPPGEHLYLLERNALRTLYKNLETGRLERFLPAALHLLEERGRLDPANREGYTRAARDFASALPALQARRLDVQGRRRRPDRAIFPLFREPFRPRLFGRPYWAAQARACRAFDLYTDFYGETSMSDVRLCEDFVEEVQRRYEEMQAEARALADERQRLAQRVTELEGRLAEQERRQEAELGRILGALRGEAGTV